jgi:hypothetical protein
MLREEAKRFLSFEVGCGKKIFLWHDKWHQEGILYKKMQKVVLMQTGCGILQGQRSWLVFKTNKLSPIW